MPGGEIGVATDTELGAPSAPSNPSRRNRLIHFWRSPPGQPGWARPALLAVTLLAGLAYAWDANSAYLEPFYGGAARSMSLNWHNFVFGAADPWGTISVDKLPGALWFQAIALRIFGEHVWVFVLPQILEGMATIVVLYDGVRRVAGAGAGVVAAVVMTTSPIVILLNHGNISDSLLILLLVASADATIRAIQSGRLLPLVCAGLFVGLAFQAKMLQAWLVVPALFLAYLVASPANPLLRRLFHVVVAGSVAAVVSLSYMTAVSLVPRSSRPYVDGSCNDSLFSQVFSYNGITRGGARWLASAGCSRQSMWLHTIAQLNAREGWGTAGIGPAWDRLLRGDFGHDDAWLLVPAVASAVGVLLVLGRAERTNPLRASVLLWLTWLVITFAAFSSGHLINSYYVAALLPAIAALCGMGAAVAWHRRRSRRVRSALLTVLVATVAVDIALVPGYVGVRDWVVASCALAGVLAAAILGASLAGDHDSRWCLAFGPALAAIAMLLGTSWASALVVVEDLGPFDSPYAPSTANQLTERTTADFPLEQKELLQYFAAVPPAQADDVLETSGSTGEDIMATGHEFLPIGGFSGVVPSPTLAQFKSDIAHGRVNRVTVATSPPTAEPLLRWVVAHCDRTPESNYDSFARTRFTVFSCAVPKARPVPATPSRGAAEVQELGHP